MIFSRVEALDGTSWKRWDLRIFLLWYTMDCSLQCRDCHASNESSTFQTWEGAYAGKLDIQFERGRSFRCRRSYVEGRKANRGTCTQSKKYSGLLSSHQTSCKKVDSKMGKQERSRRKCRHAKVRSRCHSPFYFRHGLQYFKRPRFSTGKVRSELVSSYLCEVFVTRSVLENSFHWAVPRRRNSLFKTGNPTTYEKEQQVEKQTFLEKALDLSSGQRSKVDEDRMVGNPIQLIIGRNRYIKYRSFVLSLGGCSGFGVAR